MKYIDTSNIVSGVKAPYLADTHDHYHESISEIADSLVKNIIGSYTTNDLIILYGCVISGAGPYAVTTGAIYYNGEVYQVDANASITVPGGQTLVWKIVTTYRTIDPIYYSNKSTYYTHRINKIALQAGASGSGIADYTSSTVKNRVLSNNFIKNSVKTTSASITTIESTILTLTPSTTQSSAKISISFYMNWQSSASGDDVYNITVKKNGVAIQGVMLHSTTAGFKHDHNSFYETSYTAGDIITVTVYTNNFSSTLNYAILKAESFDVNY